MQHDGNRGVHRHLQSRLREPVRSDAAAPTSDEISKNDCVADCNTKCDRAKNPDCCAKACPYTCDKKCEDRCHDDDQAVDCTPKCATACDGTCTSTSNTACQVDCQTTQWEDCQTTTREECTTSCTDKGGAIVCNGEFVNADNLQDCAAELSAKVSISLDVNVEAHVVAKAATTATNDGKSKFSCAFASAPAGNDGLWLVAAARRNGAAPSAPAMRGSRSLTKGPRADRRAR